ncbi:MAG: TM2 domain-containing protein [Candidatus Saccharibacteria bacterium]|nr:TM2 domain-containing protein [Candidatus Saccharibacteria bacterium]
MYQNTKSATTAGLLGIFLGAFGAHNWYLGERGKGIAHVCMMSGGILLEILTVAVLPNVLSWTMLIQMAWLFAVLTPVALLAMSASGIWGLVEGIIILSQGDAGLARKGYAVAEPMPMQGYGSQMNGYGPQMNNGYGPMNNNMGWNNGMGGNMNNNMNGNMGMNNMGNNMMGGMNGNMNNMGNMSGDMNNGGGDQNMNQNNMGGDNNGQQ